MQFDQRWPPLRSAETIRSIAIVTACVLAVAIAGRYAAALLPAVAGGIVLLIVMSIILYMIGYLFAVGYKLNPQPGLEGVVPISMTGRDAVVITVVVTAAPAGLLALTALAAADGIPTGGGASVAFLLGSTTAIATMLATLYIIPVMIAVRLRGRSFRDALLLSESRDVLRTTDYLGSWAIGFAAVALAGWFGSITARSLGIVGVLSAVVAAYLLIVGVRSLAIDPNN